MNLLALLLPWGLFGFQLVRAVRLGIINTLPSKLTWLMCLLLCVIVTLASRTAEDNLDGLFRELPISYTVKFLSMVLCAYAYHLILRPLSPHPERIRWADHFVPRIAIGVVVTFPLLASLPLERELLRSLMMAVRDSVVAVMMVGVLIPTTWHLLQQEQVGLMRVKHMLGLVFDVVCVIAALASATNAIGMAAGYAASGLLEGLLEASMQVRILCFLLMLVPHRWLTFLLVPQRLLTLLRLRLLVTELEIYTGRRLDLPLWTGLETRIYHQIIFLLDHYQDLNTLETRSLFRQVEPLLRTNQEYSVLVQRLAEVR